MAWSALNRRRWLLLIWLLPLLGVGWTVAQAPAWWEPRRITLTLEPGQRLILGREALFAPQADSEHVQVRREADGGWRLTNLSPSKQVLWQPTGEGDYRTIREWPLTAGATFAVGTPTLQVQIVEPGRLISPVAGWTAFAGMLRPLANHVPRAFECVVRLAAVVATPTAPRGWGVLRRSTGTG